MQKNPMRVINHKIETQFTDYHLGKIRELEYLGFVKENNFGIYEIITTKGFYHVYFTIYNDTIKINGIKELLTNKTIKWSRKLPTIYEKLSAPILQLFINESKYGENIQTIIKNKDKDNIYEIEYKNNTKYLFEIKYYKVYKIYEITNNEKTLKYTCETLIEFPKDFQKIINKNIDIYKNVETILAYEVTDNKIEYTFENFCGNKYKIIKYNDKSFDIQKSDDNISDEKMNEKWQIYNNKK